MSFFKDPYEEFFLDYLITKLENGANSKRAIQLYSEQIHNKSRFKQRLLKALKDIDIGKYALETILYKHKFLNNFQYSLVINSTNLQEGLKLVQSFTKADSNLLLKFISPILFPMVLIIGSFLALIYYLDTLFADIEYLRKLNPEVDTFLQIPTYFTYDIAYMGFYGSIFLTFLIFFGYIYFEKYKPSFLYKILKTQAFSDGRYLFRIINSMLSAGISFHKTSQILSTSYFKVGHRGFFADLALAINQNRKTFLIFEKYNYPTILVADIKLSELSKTSFVNITKGLFNTCDMMYSKNITYLITQLRLLFWSLAILVSVIVGSDLINMVISTFTFKSMYS